jgi:hypothetical protein
MSESREYSSEAVMLAHTFAAKDKVSFSEGWSRARAARPDLFGIVTNREAAEGFAPQAQNELTLMEAFKYGHAPDPTIWHQEGDRFVRNRAQSADAPLSRTELNFAICRVRNSNPGMTYVEAYNRLRSEHPGYFGSGAFNHSATLPHVYL